ncbi:MAG TPA: tRNA 2-selenouridine(34) synthase MnmH, partial [Bacilli bacterium]
FGRIESRKVVYCWRGGMRSKTTATVLSLMDIHVYRLNGGIRAYRKWVVDTLETYVLRPKVYVINGNTGSGKTALLLRLKELRYPVLDLEGLAAHRGSIFGHIGLKAHNQKTFESLLLQDLLKWSESPYLLMEAESKRIGKTVMPEFLFHAKENGIQLFIELPMEERVKHILEDYRPQEQKEACIQAFQYIKKRIHTPIAAEIEKHLYADRFAEAVYLLLEHHYDPRYKNAIENFTGERITFRCNNIDEATEMMINQIAELSNIL